MLFKRFLVMLFLLSQVSCGTILHPERKGQAAGKIDPTVALLNGVGTLLFFIPGIIAFAVDFNNGAIYLPSEGKMIKKIKKKFSAYSQQYNKKAIENVIHKQVTLKSDLKLSELKVKKITSVEQALIFN